MEPSTPTIPPTPVITTQPQPVIPPVPIKKSPVLGIIIGLLLIISLSTTGYFGYQYFKLVNKPVSSPTPVAITTPEATPDSTTDWKTYTDKTWGFSVKYPSELFTACYPDEGLKLWGPNFNCTGPHDVIYTISAIGYEDTDYKPGIKASKTEDVVVDGRKATKNTYIFSESDGPLFSLHEETEIIIPLQSGLIQLVLMGQDPANKILFDQILSTFEFTK